MPDKKTTELVQYETVKARNPITGKIQSIKIEKSIDMTPEQVAAKIKKVLTELKLEAVQEVEVQDPLTGKKSLITLDRTGTSETKLIMALADPDLDRDRKDHMLSMYLFERGKDSMSMIVDLMRYKGEHTKESRVFQSRMRFDFQSFVDSFTYYLDNQSRLLGITLDVDIYEERGLFMKWLEKNEGKGYTYKDYVRNAREDENASLEHIALVEMAIYTLDEAERLKKAIENIVKARERRKGGGIYINKAGQAFDTSDPQILEIMKQDMELEKNESGGGYAV